MYESKLRYLPISEYLIRITEMVLTRIFIFTAGKIPEI